MSSSSSLSLWSVIKADLGRVKVDLPPRKLTLNDKYIPIANWLGQSLDTRIERCKLVLRDHFNWDPEVEVPLWIWTNLFQAVNLPDDQLLLSRQLALDLAAYDPEELFGSVLYNKKLHKFVVWTENTCAYVALLLFCPKMSC
jgi:hypothetical protein